MAMQPAADTDDCDDLNWVYEHMEDLEEFEGMWIAVLGHKVIASGPGVDVVYDELTRRDINGALLFQMPEDVHREVYFIG